MTKEVQMKNDAVVKLLQHLEFATGILDAVKEQAQKVTDVSHKGIFLRKASLVGTKIDEAKLWGYDLLRDIDDAPHEFD